MDIVTMSDGKYIRIDPADIDFSVADKAQKVSDVYAVKAIDKQDVKTKLGNHFETDNKAEPGDWIIHNIGNVNDDQIPDFKNLDRRKQILAKAAIAETYAVKPDKFAETYKDLVPIGEGFYAKTMSPPRYAVAIVPFDFVIRAPWGKDEFVKAGGMIVHSGPADTYGVEKTAFENTYGVPGTHKPFAQTHTRQIMARIPVVAPAVFTRNEQAYLEAAASPIR